MLRVTGPICSPGEHFGTSTQCKPCTCLSSIFSSFLFSISSLVSGKHISWLVYDDQKGCGPASCLRECTNCAQHHVQASDGVLLTNMQCHPCFCLSMHHHLTTFTCTSDDGQNKPKNKSCRLRASAGVSEAYRSGVKAGLAMHAGTRRAACNDSMTQAPGCLT